MVWKSLKNHLNVRICLLLLEVKLEGTAGCGGDVPRPFIVFGVKWGESVSKGVFPLTEKKAKEKDH